MAPEEFLTSPLPQTEVETLVLAGCSVLRIDLGATPAGPGLRWANLPASRGGTLQRVLGYRDSAPLDTQRQGPGGNEVAEAFARAAANASPDLTRAWMEVNLSLRQWNACAMDSRGYFQIETDVRFKFPSVTRAGKVTGPFPF
jgi:hypothetical protein